MTQFNLHRSAGTDTWPINREAVVRDPKLLAVAEIRRDFGIVDDVLAGQAHDVWTRSADIFAIDDGDALSFSGERPRSDR